MGVRRLGLSRPAQPRAHICSIALGDSRVYDFRPTGHRVRARGKAHAAGASTWWRETGRESRRQKSCSSLLPLALIVAAQTGPDRIRAGRRPTRIANACGCPWPGRVEPASYYLTPPQYVIEPPDILLINAVKLIPKSPHKLEPFDSLLVRVLGALPDQPIADAFAVDPDGTIDLGPTYGRVEVSGLTVDEAQQAIKQSLEKVLEKPQVSVSLACFGGRTSKSKASTWLVPTGASIWESTERCTSAV